MNGTKRKLPHSSLPHVIVTELDDGRLAIDIPDDCVTLVYSRVGPDGVGKVSIRVRAGARG